MKKIRKFLDGKLNFSIKQLEFKFLLGNFFFEKLNIKVFINKK